MGQRIGQMKCLNPACGCTDAAVEVTAAGTWQAKCHRCGMPTFAKAGTKWRRDMEKLVTRDEDEAAPETQPDEPPAKTPAAPPAPEPRKPNPARPPMTAFNLADL